MSNAVKALFARTASGIKPGLEVTIDLLAKLDNPHYQVPCIHVAGTNGKGSVSSMIASVLQASGYKVGLYTSPHLVEFSERFRINGEPIAQDALEDYIQQLEMAADAVEQETGGRGATFFEISTALAFQYFYDQRVELAVIETGMGGRWDATNVIIPLLSVITHIDVDHTAFLGDRLAEIAAEKAGIIKPNRPVVSAPQCAEAMAALRQPGNPVIVSSEAVAVSRRGGDAFSQRLHIETQDEQLPPIELPMQGACQRENVGVAVAALEVLREMIAFEPAYKEGLESVAWSARFERISQEPVMILDGAHNPSAATELVKTLKEVYPSWDVGFVLGFLEDKDAGAFLRILNGMAAAAWTVPLAGPRGSTAEESAMLAKMVGLQAVPETVGGALSAAKAWCAEKPQRLICVTGSLYLKQALAELG